MLPKELADAMRKQGKKILTLIMRQEYFDQIIDGTKKTEYRELKSTTYKQLVERDKNGAIIYDEKNDNHAIPIRYDALLMFCGYAKVRDSALVEVVGAEEHYVLDDNGDPIIFAVEGEELLDVIRDDKGYLAKVRYDDDGNIVEQMPFSKDTDFYEHLSRIAYSLGKILCKDIHSK